MELLSLPYPPTVNTYWRRVGNKTILSAKARDYRREVWDSLRFRSLPTLTGDVELVITFYPPDRRKRDLDNLPTMRGSRGATGWSRPSPSSPTSRTHRSATP